MFACKLLHCWQTIRNTAADGVEAFEFGWCFDMFGEVIDHRLETLQRFGGLGKEIRVAREVNLVHFAYVGYHDGFAVGLSHESEHFCVSVLAINHNLGIIAHFVIHPSDALLEIQDHGASGIDKRDVVATRCFVSRGRFAVCTEQHSHIVEFFKSGMVNHHQSTLAEAFAFAAIVHDVAKAVENIAFGEFVFRLFDGTCHAKAEARTSVDFRY